MKRLGPASIGTPPGAGFKAVLARGTLKTTAIALLVACLSLCGCGKGGEGRSQAEGLRSAYAEMRARMADLEGFFPETEELLAAERDEGLAEAVLRLVEEKRRLYGELLLELDGLSRGCSELEEVGGAYAFYAASLRELVEVNREEAAALAGALLTVEELARRLPLDDPKELPAFTRRIDEAAARVEELRSSLRAGEDGAEGEWRRL